MAQLVIDAPVLRIEGLETKYDTVPVSSSLSLLLDSELEAKIVQQLHFWTQQESSGVLYKGMKWIYKSVREWIEEVLPIWSRGQVNRALASLVEKGVIVKEHLFKKHHGHNYDPKNRTLYYSLVYEKLQELAETTKLLSFYASKKTDFLSVEKQISHQRENNTKITPIKNIQEKTAIQSIAAAEIENSVSEKAVTKEEQYLAPPSVENSSQSEPKPKNPTKDKKAPRVEEKINAKKPKIDRERGSDLKSISNRGVEKIVNQDWRSHLDELEKLGVAINKTVSSLVKLYKTELVEQALAVFRNRKKESNVVNAAGYFVQALKQGWGATKVATVSQDDSEDTVDTQAVFRLWYDLARELGYCSGQKVAEGVQWVNMNGSWETWEAAFERGYSLDYLKGVRRRQNN